MACSIGTAQKHSQIALPQGTTKQQQPNDISKHITKTVLAFYTLAPHEPPHSNESAKLKSSNNSHQQVALTHHTNNSTNN